MILKAHHTITTQPASCSAEEELYDEQVEEVALDDGAVVLDVAEEIEWDEAGAEEGEYEEEYGASSLCYGEESDESTGEISCVPDEEA